MPKDGIDDGHVPQSGQLGRAKAAGHPSRRLGLIRFIVGHKRDVGHTQYLGCDIHKAYSQTHNESVVNN